MPTYRKGFLFHVIGSPSAAHTTKNVATLKRDNWDDFGHKTSFDLTIFDSKGDRHEIGFVKIGQAGRGERPGYTNLEKQFEQLDEDFFSLGQADTYYDNLNQLGQRFRLHILESLRDIALSEPALRKARKEPVTEESLFRTITDSELEQFKRIARGGVRRTPFRFEYTLPSRLAADKPPAISVSVEPASYPPTNLHVLIGRNGAGKTYAMNSMLSALTSKNSDALTYGKFKYRRHSNKFGRFSNLVSVSFSAFDDFRVHAANADTEGTVKAVRIGLPDSLGQTPTKAVPNSALIGSDFAESLDKCRSPGKRELWDQALRTLETDPGFEALHINDKLGSIERDEDEKNAYIAPEDQVFSFFTSLSSGHQIVLLSITKLVEHVEQNTLVLVDEPETHLHPPLLSAFIRSLSDLLIERNGVAIVATHSPVVLQEVPKSCVSIIDRVGTFTKLERPTFETFGENLGTLTREVFGDHVTTADMTALYENHLARKESVGRTVYDAIKAQPRQRRCPLCGFGTVNTLDHYLPKAVFPHLAVTPANLVPACRDCNTAKKSSFAGSPDKLAFHPYYDNFDDARWLHAAIIEGAPLAVRYYVDPPDSWDQTKQLRARHHFATLELAEPYQSHAITQIGNLQHLLVRLSEQDGSHSVRKHLEEGLESISKNPVSSRNSWEAALYVAMVESEWFCNGGFRNL